jgi:Flp pilus assembly pilin Flp
MKKRKGQSILEYVIIFAVVVAAVIVGARSFIKGAVEQGMSDSASAMKTAT